MNFEELIGSTGVYAASFVVGFVSGFVPVVNAEVYLLLVASTVSRPALAPVALLTTAGQMAAKTVLFYAGRGAVKIPMGRYESKLDKVQAKFHQWENRAGLLILVSASVGMPPFYVVSIVAGTMKMHVLKFIVAGFIGRAIRFGAIAYFPQLVMRFID